VTDELTRVVLGTGTMDERRLASSKDRQPKGVQARRIDDVSFVSGTEFATGCNWA
jgi:hypothetical protein